jgi:nickel transport protein
MALRGEVLAILAAVAVLVPRVGLGHGADVAATVTRHVEVELAVAVEATYHSGRPMAGARVTVMAPGAPDEPWLVGQCDADGRFEFAPPVDRPGTWDVLVAHQGHGGRVSVEIGGEGKETASAVVTAEASSTAHLSVLQRVVMGACVVWGLIGTALFFSRRRG